MLEMLDTALRIGVQAEGDSVDNMPARDVPSEVVVSAVLPADSAAGFPSFVPEEKYFPKSFVFSRFPGMEGVSESFYGWEEDQT